MDGWPPFYSGYGGYPHWIQPSPYMQPIPTDPNEAIGLVREYMSVATKHRNEDEKLNIYSNALRICENHEHLYIKAAEIHCKMAEVYLRKRDINMAKMQAEESIRCNPDCFEGYYQRAESTREQVYIHVRKGTPAYNPSLAKTLSANAIGDYLDFYKKTLRTNRDLSCICKALMLALDSGNITLVPLVELVRTKEECTDLILQLVTLRISRCKHLDYLIRETDIKGSAHAIRLGCDLSQVKCHDVLRKQDINNQTFEAVLKLGVQVSLSDIENAITSIDELKLDSVLELLISACEPSLKDKHDQLTALCCRALSNRRLSIAASLIIHGAKPESSEVFKVLDWKSLNQNLVQYLVSTPNGCAQMVKKAVESPLYTNVLQKCIEGEFGPLNTEQTDLSDFISSNTFQTNPDLLEKLLTAGINPNGLPDGRKPLDVVLAMPKSCTTEERIQLVCSLSKHGASFDQATYPRTQGTTIVHLATEMALETSDIAILETVCNHYSFPEDGKVTDKDSKTPLHIVMHRKYSEIAEKACQILCSHINPHVKDNKGKKASELRPNDKRKRLLLEATEKFPSIAKPVHHKGGKKKGGKNTKAKSGHRPRDTNSCTDDQLPESSNAQPENESSSNVSRKLSTVSNKPQDTVLSSIQNFLDNFARKPDSYFKQPPDYKRQSSLQKTHHKQPEPNTGVTTIQTQAPTAEMTLGQIEQEQMENGIFSQEPKKDAEVDVDEKLFDGLPWEVEFPEKVLKFFKDRKVQQYIRKQAIAKIQRLAHGIPTNNDKLCKMLVRSPNLFEARVTKAVRIIYEIAVQFSSRLTNSQESVEHIYSEVIRIWDIVLDHDNLDHSIELAINRIKKSRERGQSANTITPLQIPVQKDTLQQRGEELRFPQSYVDYGVDKTLAAQVAAQISFTPAGSAREDEYNVVTFYTFDSAFVKSILEGENDRRDFPFKEWPKEHDIINMKQGKCSILLLGRSGTGKTTCCLYRLWNHFKAYWTIADPDDDGLVPRRPLIPSRQDDCELQEESISDDETDENHQEEHSKEEEDEPDDPNPDEDLALSSDINEDTHHNHALEHFHQVFVTKNYVLCSQMKRRFYDLAAGNDVAENHMPFEDQNLSSTIEEIEHLAYPLFLTARQFFVLLDNSLGDEENFFPRDENGELTEKIVSSDYDHEDPDTLLDLEFESDSDADESDEEGEVESQPAPSKKKLSERKEVTASYFAEKIWPKISHFCADKKTDPLLVWMEIKSFIKGSRKAVQSEQGYLTEREYEEVGIKMASNFAGNRKEVYKLFEKYQHFLKQTTDENLFDECELVHNIHSRLNKLQDLPWSIHSFYIDEVQDFTQAELSVLLRCCRDPNDLFLTGDTAQSIMRGISFRFSDLRSLFHGVQAQAKKVKKAVTVTVPKVHELTINFRSHSGVLQLAASVINILKEYFPSSFDRLPGDEGMFPGPIPKVLDSCNVSDLALVLRGNKRESTTIEFGAHQVIIVQSEEAKKALPDVLQAGIVLTVFEAKGLEFDDVLLYDFFKYSKVTKEWRVVRSYLESKPELETNPTPVFGSEPRSLAFDEQYHKSLNAELKYLYTAITRAKCNLWIYDSDETKRLPMFDYWHKIGLVKVIRVKEISEEDQSSLFTATSSKEEWKEQGDYFKKKRLWEPAMKCYHKAEEIHLEREAKAYFLVQQARASGQKPVEMQEHYLRAALAFLECDKSKHDHKCLRYAAMCLKNAKRHTEAGKLYARLDKQREAFKQFKKSNNIQACAQLKEDMGDYNGAVMLLVKSRRMIDALEYSKRYEQEKRVKLQQECSTAYLATTYAKQILQEGAHKKMVRVAEYIPDIESRIYYLKAAGRYDEVFQIYRQNGHYEQMYKLYDVRGEYSKALSLAEAKKDEKWAATFVFKKATTELVSNGRIQDRDLVMQLQRFITSNDVNHKAKACLFLGKSSKDAALCQRAFEHYKLLNPAGYVESFNLMVEQGKTIHYTHTIDACRKAEDIVAAIRDFQEKGGQYQAMSEVHSNTLVQVEDFYGLVRQHGRGEYHFPPREDQHLWISFSSSNAKFDEHGMMILEAEYALDVVLSQMNRFLKKWKEDDYLSVCKTIKERMVAYQFHKQLENGGHLLQSFRISSEPLLHGYLKLLDTALLVCDFKGHAAFQKEVVVRLLVNLIGPQASTQLDLKKGHLNALKQSVSGQCMLRSMTRILAKKDEQFSMNEWLDVWRVHSVMGKGTAEIDRNLYSRVNKMPTTPPNCFRYDKLYKRYDHTFTFWLTSCLHIRKENKVITSTKLVLHFVLDMCARRKTIRSTLSVTNIVNILTIHSVAMLSLATFCNQLLKQQFKAFVPSSYQHVIRYFDDLNRQSDSDKKLLEACMVDAKVLKARVLSVPALQRVRDEIIHLLWQMLDMLLGKYNEYYNPLKYAVEREMCLQRDEARQCVVLALTLFINLVQTGQHLNVLYPYQLDILYALQKLAQYNQKYSNARDQFSQTPSTAGAVSAVYQLLRSADERDQFVQIITETHPWRFLFKPYSFQRIPPLPLTPIPPEYYIIEPLVKVSSGQQVAMASVSAQGTPSTFNYGTFAVEELEKTAIHPTDTHPSQSTAIHRSSVESLHNLPTTFNTLQNTSQSFPIEEASQLSRQISNEPEEDDDEPPKDMEIDEELREALEPHAHVTRQFSHEDVQDSVMEDTSLSMIEQSLCKICVIRLRPDNTTGDDIPKQPDKEDIIEEGYTHHLESRKHEENTRLYERFQAVHKEYYQPVTEKLQEVLERCHSYVAEHLSPTLNNMVITINEQLRHNEKEISEIKNYANWRAGASSIQNEMYGKMDSLIAKAEKELEEEKQRVKYEKEVALKTEEETIEEEDYDLMKEDEDEGIEEVEKPTSKQMKRNRKKQRKHRKK